MRGRGGAEGAPGITPSPSARAPMPPSLMSHLDGLSAEGLQHFGADLVCTCTRWGREKSGGERGLGR